MTLAEIEKLKESAIKNRDGKALRMLEKLQLRLETQMLQKLEKVWG